MVNNTDSIIHSYKVIIFFSIALALSAKSIFGINNDLEWLCKVEKNSSKYCHY